MANKTLKAQVLIGGAITAGLRSALGTTKDGLKQIGEAIVNVDRRQRLLGQSIQTFSRMGRNVDGLRMQYAALTREADRLRAAQARLAAVNKAVEANMDRRAQLRGQMGGAVGGLIATGFAVGSTLNPAAQFQRENQLIGNTANMTSAEVRALGETILRVSKQTNQSTDEVQRAIGFLVAAGMDVKQAQASLLTIGRTTTATGADIEDLARAAFTLQDSLKIDPAGLQDALDMLAVAGKEGNVELKDMAKTLPVLGSSFVALKMQGREATATLGAALEVARKGAADSDEAANNMRNFMAKILSPETLKKAQKNFGLDLYAVIQKAQTNGGNPFEAAMQAIMKATAGDQKKIGELFQDMQVQNFLRPMIQNWDEYRRIKNKALNESAGTTDRDFETMMGTASEQMKSVKIAAKQLAIAVGESLMPAVGDTAKSLTGMLNAATGFVKQNPELVGGVIKGALALSALRVAALGVGYAWTFIKGPILSVMGFVARWRAGGAVAAMGRFAGAGLRVVSVMRWVGTAIAAIGGGPVAIAVAAVVGAAILVRKYWQPIGAFFRGLWEGVQSALAPAFGQLVTAMQPLKPLWDAVAEAIGKAWKWITDLIAPTQYTSEELTKVAQVGRVVGTVLANSMLATIQAVTWVIEKFVEFHTKAVQIATAIREAFTAAFDAVKGAVGAAMDWINGKMQPVLNGIGWVMDKIGGGTSSAVPALAGAGAGRVPPAVSSIRSGSSSSATTNTTNTFNITQQPGESADALADKVVQRIEQRKGVQQRGRLND